MKPFTLRSPGRAGFTIVELVMAIAVGGVVITATLGAFITMQRSGAIYMASGEARGNQVRLVEALQRDLRNATGFGPSGPPTTTPRSLPFTRVLPGRYQDYESTGNRSGEPKPGAGSIIALAVDSAVGRVTDGDAATVRFFATSEPNRLVVHREVTWSQLGILRTASRPIAHFAPGAAITITGISQPIKGTTRTTVRAVEVKVRAAAATQRIGRAPAVVEMSETVFLRGKFYARK